VKATNARAAVAFNEAVNRRDLAALGELMTDGHAFTDSDANVVAGKEEVLKAWEGFFEAFPDYRNEWSRVIPAGGTLVAVGRSICSDRAASPWPGDLGGHHSRRQGLGVACLRGHSGESPPAGNRRRELADAFDRAERTRSPPAKEAGRDACSARERPMTQAGDAPQASSRCCRPSRAGSDGSARRRTPSAAPS
jgi:SnoaL-like domain